MHKLISLTLLLLLSFNYFAGNKVIAISYFDNTTADSKYTSLSKGIADMLITDLSKLRDIEIVEREKLEELIKEIKLGNSSYIDKNTAQKLGKGLGAEAILTGAFYVLDGVLRIDARLINVASGKVIAAEEVTGSTKDFFSLHKQLVNLLVKSFSIKYNSKTESVVDYDNKIELMAVVNYSNALTYEDNGLQENATDLLESTIKQYPEFLFAKTKLDKIRAFIAEREAERERLLTLELNNFLASIDTNSATYTTALMSIWSNMISSYAYSSVLTFNNQLKKKGIPLSKTLSEGGTETIGELLAFYDCLALFTLKKNKPLIEKSKAFLTQYPTSKYFNSVKSNLNATLEELEKIELGKKNIKTYLTYSELNVYIKYFNSLRYYAYKRFIQKENYAYFKELYIQKVIKGDKKILDLLGENDVFNEVTNFFEFAKINLDRELMVQIKDLALNIYKDTDLEEDAYRLENKIEDFDKEMEKHQSKKADVLADINSNDIAKISKAIQWFWLMRDKKEEEFVMQHSLAYLDLKETREVDRVYSIRLRAFENIIESLNRLGDFKELEKVLERYLSDEYLILHKNKEYESKAKEFKDYLRKGLKDYALFEKNILTHDIKSNLLIGQAGTYSDHYQYFDEISVRKEVLDKYELDPEVSELQHYFLFIAYSKAGLFKEMNEFGTQFLQQHPTSNYSESIKALLTYSPK